MVPSLQHWIFTEDLVGHFPEARILWAPAACGEDLAVKMPGLAGRAEELINGFSQLGDDLEVRINFPSYQLRSFKKYQNGKSSKMQR